MIRLLFVVFLCVSLGVSAFAVDLERRQQCIAVGNQCGGSSYTGVKTCCSGAVCTVRSQLYSQCTAASNAAPSPAQAQVPSPSPSPAGQGSAGCGKTPTLKTGFNKITSGGTSRSYHISIPDNYSNTRPYRLIFGLHWLSGSYNDVVNGNSIEPYYGLKSRSDNSAIFIAPDGIDKGWANTNNRDTNLMDDLLKLVQSDLCIDTSRIFATGFSYGGGMSFSLACNRPKVFRAVAVLSGAQLSGCEGGTTPVAYLGVHGLIDSVLNISNGRTLRDKFANLSKCTTSNPPEPSRGSGSHICTKYAGCNSAYPVTWCAHDGDHNPNEKDRGQSTSWIPNEVWQFFSQF